jgi:hypothetical protein
MKQPPAAGAGHGRWNGWTDLGGYELSCWRWAGQARREASGWAALPHHASGGASLAAPGGVWRPRPPQAHLRLFRRPTPPGELTQPPQGRYGTPDWKAPCQTLGFRRGGGCIDGQAPVRVHVNQLRPAAAQGPARFQAPARRARYCPSVRLLNETVVGKVDAVEVLLARWVWNRG